MDIAEQKQTLSVKQARRILGTTSKGLSDEAIKRLISKVEILTDIVVNHVDDSKIQSRVLSTEVDESILERHKQK
jgi:hypothetical protein